ncbi:MAG TPA: hypothetical protein VIQ31_09590, partial [Phormidium sp.]
TKEPPKIFGDKFSITSSWREGFFSCEGILPNNTRPNYFYSLHVKPIRAVRSVTSHEIRCQQENALSQVATHRFELTYRQALIVDGKAVNSSSIPVFRIEKSCWLPKKPTTDSNWNAVMKIAPSLVNEIRNICNESEEESVLRLTGVRMQAGQTLNNLELSNRKSKAEYFRQYNTRKLLLTPHPSRTVNKSEEWWKRFINNALKELEKSQ